eukprot:scaffold2164_cov120-Skeletonema_marinoi.AAC.2
MMQVFGYPIHSISIQVNCNSPKRAHAVSLQKVDSSRQEITRTVPSLLIPTSYFHEYHNFSSNLHSIGYLAALLLASSKAIGIQDLALCWDPSITADESLPIARLSVVSISGQAPMCKYFDALARVDVRMLMWKHSIWWRHPNFGDD